MARSVVIVLSGAGALRVLLDGRPRAVVRGLGTSPLYPVLRLRRPAVGRLELRVPPGVAAYAFALG